MKFTISKNRIVNVLSKIQGITGRKSNLAITECVLIRSSQNFIKLFATDLETGFEGEYEAEVETAGVIAINARKFYEIIREFPSESIEIREVDNRWIEIGNENVQFHIVGMNPDDFPESPYVEDVNFIDVESLPLRKMIERTTAISGVSDDKRAHINGIYMECLTTDHDPVLRMVSTDGSRLSCVEYELSPDIDLSSNESVLIPKKGLQEVAKFLSSEGSIQFGLAGSYLIIKNNSETTIIRLLEGDFPQYDAILQKAEHYVVKVDKEQFNKMLKRMSILSSENYRAAIFKFDSDQLLITATNPDLGESKEDMSIEFGGELIEAAFNPKFFIDTLSHIDENEVLIYIYSDNKPCLIEGTNDKSYLSVIMPMRI
jgi:DNA polymerase-3 subunit beta